MALTYVGGTTSSAVGSTGTNLTVSLTSLTGGVASAPAEGDIVIVSYATGSTSDRDLNVVTSGYTRHCDLYSNDSYDTNLWVATKIMGSTPDTSVVLPPSADTSDAITVNIQVWRASSGYKIYLRSFDIQTATGVNTGRPTPPAITPTYSGSIIICGGAGAYSSVIAEYTSSLDNFVSKTQADSNSSYLGMGSYAWTSGTYTPTSWGGGVLSVSASWCAFSLILTEGIKNPLLNKDLIAYWKLDGNSKNETGYQYDGTDTDITYNASYGKIGQGALFNGTSSSILTKAMDLPVTGFTISLWAKTLINHSGFTSIINFTDMTIYLNTLSALGLSLKDSLGTTLINTSSGNINDGNLHHIVIQMNGSGVATQVYLDGKVHLTGTGAAFTGNFNGVIPRLAGNFTSTYFNGYIDEVAIWNRALTGEEIQQVFYAGNGNTYPLQTNMADMM